jgi:integrase
MSLYKHPYYVFDFATKQKVKKLSDDWYFRFNRDGKTYAGSTGSSNKTTAARFEEKKKREVDAILANGDSKSVTIKQAFAIYTEASAKHKQLANIKSRIMKMLGSTTDTRNRTIVPVFGFDGNRKFESLTTADLQQLVLKRRAEGTADGTILTELGTLSQTIVLLRKLDHLVPNIDFKDLKKDNAVRPSKGRLRFLSRAEEAAFLEQLDPEFVFKRELGGVEYEQRQDAFDIAHAFLDVGGRYSEITHLRFKDINVKKGTIALWRNKVQNESTLGMTARVKAMFERRIANKRDDQVYVWEAKDGTARKHSPKVFQTAFERAGITGATLHTLRHTFASKLAQNGATLQEIKELMGHSSIVTTMIYAHLLENKAAKRAVEILDAL